MFTRVNIFFWFYYTVRSITSAYLHNQIYPTSTLPKLHQRKREREKQKVKHTENSAMIIYYKNPLD